MYICARIANNLNKDSNEASTLQYDIDIKKISHNKTVFTHSHTPQLWLWK